MLIYSNDLIKIISKFLIFFFLNSKNFTHFVIPTVLKAFIKKKYVMNVLPWHPYTPVQFTLLFILIFLNYNCRCMYVWQGRNHMKKNKNSYFYLLLHNNSNSSKVTAIIIKTHQQWQCQQPNIPKNNTIIIINQLFCKGGANGKVIKNKGKITLLYSKHLDIL